MLLFRVPPAVAVYRPDCPAVSARLAGYQVRKSRRHWTGCPLPSRARRWTIPDQCHPLPAADQYAASAGQTLNVAAPGLLANDLEGNALRQGNQLAIRHSLNPGLGSLVGLSINEYQQDLYLYPAFGAAVHLIDRLGVSQGNLPMQGEPANDVDLDITAQAFVLKDSQIPQGSLLIFNGETNATEIYAVQPGDRGFAGSA